jgi:predicted AAA+ superfamily ATPase
MHTCYLGELATLLSGRYIEIKMLPLSFKEYYEASIEKDKRTAFANFINTGAFPMLATEMAYDNETADKYLEGIYNTILIKDVVTRKGVGDVQLLKNIVKYLCSNIGSLISIKNITDYINNSGRTITQKTVDKYINALTESYLFYNAERYNIRGKQLLKTLSKYYVIDTGLCNFLLSIRNADWGHKIENIVYFELLRRGYRVNVGKIDDREIDFVATKMDTKEYYQVTYTMLDDEVKKRELYPLQKVDDYFPRIVLTLDDFEGTYEGIKQINLIKWLLQE